MDQPKSSIFLVQVAYFWCRRVLLIRIRSYIFISCLHDMYIVNLWRFSHTTPYGLDTEGMSVCSADLVHTFVDSICWLELAPPVLLFSIASLFSFSTLSAALIHCNWKAKDILEEEKPTEAGPPSS